jgi:hypothetical protein
MLDYVIEYKIYSVHWLHLISLLSSFQIVFILEGRLRLKSVFAFDLANFFVCLEVRLGPKVIVFFVRTIFLFVLGQIEITFSDGKTCYAKVVLHITQESSYILRKSRLTYYAKVFKS